MSVVGITTAAAPCGLCTPPYVAGRPTTHRRRLTNLGAIYQVQSASIGLRYSGAPTAVGGERTPRWGWSSLRQVLRLSWLPGSGLDCGSHMPSCGGPPVLTDRAP